MSRCDRSRGGRNLCSFVTSLTIVLAEFLKIPDTDGTAGSDEWGLTVE